MFLIAYNLIKNSSKSKDYRFISLAIGINKIGDQGALNIAEGLSCISNLRSFFLEFK